MRAILVTCILLVTITAHADPKPWARGVSDSEQSRALEIYKQGNAEFEEARYAQALTNYRKALEHWDHPSIRYNIVVCLINLDQPLEAYDNLEHALAFGSEPFTAEVYAQALTYKKLLLAQLAKIQVATTEANAEVTLDGKRLFTGPGDVTQLVAPGTHQIVAMKPGFLTATIPVTVMGGKLGTARVEMHRLETARVERRWSAWKPWFVAAAGLAIAAVGVPFELRARSNFRAYDGQFAASCPRGCGGPGEPELPADLASMKHTGTYQTEIAIALFAIGGSALATGLIGVYLNQPHMTSERPVTLTPIATSNSASLLVGGQF